MPLSNILRFTLHQEVNNPKVVSFFVKGAPAVNYNIKFVYEWEARHFLTHRVVTNSTLFSHQKTWIIMLLLLRIRDLGYLHSKPFIFSVYQLLPEYCLISWARIYSNWRPVIVAHEYLNNDDIGFKLLDNENHLDLDERLEKLPYIFKRSEIANEIRTSPPNTLYLRNITRAEDYEIMFQTIRNLNTFLELFPQSTYDECATKDYYFIPYLGLSRR